MCVFVCVYIYIYMYGLRVAGCVGLVFRRAEFRAVGLSVSVGAQEHCRVAETLPDQCRTSQLLGEELGCPGLRSSSPTTLLAGMGDSLYLRLVPVVT